MKQLFIIDNSKISLNSISSSYYCSVFKVWKMLHVHRSETPCTISDILLEPIWFNPLLHYDENVFTDHVIDCFTCSNITLIQDLFSPKEFPFMSKRLSANYRKLLLTRSMPDSWIHIIGNNGDIRTAHTYDIIPDMEIGASTGETISLFSPPCKKSLYTLFVQLHSINNNVVLLWTDLLSFKCDDVLYFSNVFSKMLTKLQSDMMWKILHGAIPTGNFLFSCHFAATPNCLFCDDLDDLLHIFYTCPRLSALFVLVRDLIRKLLPHIDKIPTHWLITGMPIKSKKSNHFKAVQLCNWIIAISKLSIVHSRWNKANNKALHNVVQLFKVKLFAKLSLQYSYAYTFGNMDTFMSQWNIGESLCSLHDGTLRLSI